MSDGNSQTPLPESTISSDHHIMAPLAGGFGPMVTTSDVKAGMGNIESVSLTAPDGSSIMAEHHQLGLLVPQAPTQDIPPGETKASA